MARKVAIVKIAAIGDVALACRALLEFHCSFEYDLEFHWVVDEKLAPLARALTPGIEIHWHPLNATALFSGGNAEKARSALKMARAVARIQPKFLVLLHRDWRYRALFRGVFTGSILGIDRVHAHELEIYRSMFTRLASKLKLKKNHDGDISRIFNARSPSGKIGILVGGAQNQKQAFLEKRWPRFRELVQMLLERSDHQIVLFGGPEDRASAEAVLELDHRGRVEDKVGKTDLSRIPEALAELDRFISVDSGLSHIAANVMTGAHQKTVALFGPTDPMLWAPKAAGRATATALYQRATCSPCYANDGNFKPCRFEGERFQHCMTEITPAQVVAALELKLGPKHS